MYPNGSTCKFGSLRPPGGHGWLESVSHHGSHHPKDRTLKFNPTWTQLALLVILLAAIVLTNLFSPGVIGTITSIVSTVVGALFVNLKESPKE